MSDFLLGGKDHYEADRLAVTEILKHAPGMLAQVRAQRDFLARAVRRLAREWHIDQFIELGSGMPVWPAVHEIAGWYRQGSRVVYVDNDPIVVSHSRALLDNGETAIAVDGDLRAPGHLLNALRLTGAIDFRRPVGVLCGAVLDFLPDTGRAMAVLRAFRAALASGSALVISHLCGDHADPAAVAAVEQVYARANAPLTVRTRTEIAGLFEGFELERPGLTEVTGWPGPADPVPRAGISAYGGAARYRPHG